jgi:hypothetical protein
MTDLAKRSKSAARSPARRTAAVLALLGVAFALVVWETFFAHELADFNVGPYTACAVACVALAGLFDVDGRVRFNLWALARTLAYLLVVYAALAIVYFIWLARSYTD